MPLSSSSRGLDGFGSPLASELLSPMPSRSSSSSCFFSGMGSGSGCGAGSSSTASSCFSMPLPFTAVGVSAASASAFGVPDFSACSPWVSARRRMSRDLRLSQWGRGSTLRRPTSGFFARPPYSTARVCSSASMLRLCFSRTASMRALEEGSSPSRREMRRKAVISCALPSWLALRNSWLSISNWSSLDVSCATSSPYSPTMAVAAPTMASWLAPRFKASTVWRAAYSCSSS
mmetsp:Transcript_6376/g.18348  ORF Transcript_6376/g.18348 Transcript_6376/m.18348 type:complete len:232 (+) Transcript_6376:1840-2535(+)